MRVVDMYMKGDVDGEGAVVAGEAVPSAVQDVIQGPFPLSWSKLKRKRAAKEFEVAVQSSVGMIKRGGLNEEGTDIDGGTRETLAYLREQLPGVETPWDHCYCLTEDVWDAVSALPSPRRRTVWRALSDVDAVVPPIIRERKSRILQSAYRCHLARWRRQRAREEFFFAMVVRLQRNIKVAWARREIPKRKIAMKQRIEDAKRKKERDARRTWLKAQPASEVAKLGEEDVVLWIMLHAPSVAEVMVRRLLALTQGDPAKALNLCGAAATANARPVTKLGIGEK
mmetsp:Transcript_46663/g.112155  ORF Transcript_46663/g.112155 Transcript_46663/m.112155 type:complete len:283 (+) Transcript_46663:3-851(+)